MRGAVRAALRAGVVAAGLAVVLAGTAGCVPVDPQAPANPDHAAAPDGGGAGSAGQARALRLLGALTVAPWASMSGYRRDRFEHWSSQSHGCDTRDVVLQRDGQGVRTVANCTIVAGTWWSAYDGRTTTDPAELDIDHMIPLANAWRTGADTWTAQQRQDFANDLVRPQLIAVTATTNRAKGDQDPSQWRPPRREYWCQYAQRWISVKAHWSLRVTGAEKAALTEMLGSC